ncbi:uncharacterized protein LOC132310261 [Cornus florida]|uniref:uncharacterized protein LOC132310261 n=1 Tax=Cornus florida TaxID=4283 RepID=UPI002899AD6A|nr:uncharacterized protein LOC132310261 [Cornus florida]
MLTSQSQMATKPQINLKLFNQKNAIINLKLLVNKAGKVLFAEAGKDFVDFLFGLLEVPLGSTMALLIERGKTTFGSLGSVYRSARGFDNSYLLPNHKNKDFLSRPTAASSSTVQTPTLYGRSPFDRTAPVLFACSGSSSFGFPNTPAKPDQLDGYVKDVVTYMVMDDLVVKPMSTISSITLLNTSEVKDVGCLQEMTVEVDMEKGLEIVQASFYSNTVLSDVFLP